MVKITKSRAYWGEKCPICKHEIKNSEFSVWKSFVSSNYGEVRICLICGKKELEKAIVRHEKNIKSAQEKINQIDKIINDNPALRNQYLVENL